MSENNNLEFVLEGASEPCVLDPIKLNDSYLSQNSWRVKENSNVSFNIGGLILFQSGTLTSQYWLNKIYPKEVKEAHEKCFIHCHDLSFYGSYCNGLSLADLIKEGLGGVRNKISSKPAKHLDTLCNQMVNMMGIIQNEAAGAVSFSAFDTYLAPFIKKDNLTDEQIKQALSSYLFGMNVPARWGCVPKTTKVLTIEGWKGYDELSENDLIYTWKNGKLNICKVNKVVKKHYKDKLIEFYNDHYRYSQTVSKDHRTLTYKTNKKDAEIVLAKDIQENKYNKYWTLPTSFTEINVYEGIDLTDDEIRLAAMIYTDGSIDMRKDSVHKIRYYKSDLRLKNLPFDPEEVFENCGLSYKKKKSISSFMKPMNTWNFYGDSARKILNIVKQRDKIADIFYKMNQRQARLFLETWSLHDGDEVRHRCQCDNDTIVEQILHLHILAGKIACRNDIKKSTYTKTIEVDSVGFKIREHDYDDVIWCPSVDDGTAIFMDENNRVFISGQSQPPFSNITLDLVCPEDLKDQHPYVGGKKVSFTYGDCQEEMNRLNTILFELYDEGDAVGNSFQYPIPTVNIDPDFPWESPVVEGLFKITASKGIPYFANMVNTGFKKGDIRSMCLHPETYIDVKLKEDVMYDEKENKYFSIKQAQDMCLEINKVYKKGHEITDYISRFTAVAIEVLGPNGYETPEEMQILPFKGKLKKLYLKSNDDPSIILNLMLTPDHLSIIFEGDRKINRRTDELLVGDQFEFTSVANTYRYTIDDIEEVEYEGKVYDFTMPSHEFYANGFLTHNCCRLQLDLKALQKHSTGGVGAFADKTGSIGVVTLNLPKMAYLSKGDEESFFKYVDHYMDVASKSLVIKRRVCDKLLEQDFYPYLKRYMKHWNNHFSTIGFVGLNEACENFFKDGSDIASRKGLAFAEKVLDHMRERLQKYQEETGNLYNLEASPAESTSYRFAKHDVEDHPDIKTAGEKPKDVYYTNSCHLPVKYTDDVWKAIKHQEKLQSKLTGGSVLHCFLGESVDDWRKVRDFIKNVMENSKLPYITISPTYSVCPIHGLLKGNHSTCPHCKEEQLKKYKETLDKIDQTIKELTDEIVKENVNE